jgi:uncharacterized protein YneF (UPF0154 family)
MIIALVIIYLAIGFFSALRVMAKQTSYQPLLATNNPLLYLILSSLLWPVLPKTRG